MAQSKMERKNAKKIDAISIATSEIHIKKICNNIKLHFHVQRRTDGRTDRQIAEWNDQISFWGFWRRSIMATPTKNNNNWNSEASHSQQINHWGKMEIVNSRMKTTADCLIKTCSKRRNRTKMPIMIPPPDTMQCSAAACECLISPRLITAQHTVQQCYCETVP